MGTKYPSRKGCSICHFANILRNVWLYREFFLFNHDRGFGDLYNGARWRFEICYQGAPSEIERLLKTFLVNPVTSKKLRRTALDNKLLGTS